jgi:hypothetical protein
MRGIPLGTLAVCACARGGERQATPVQEVALTPADATTVTGRVMAVPPAIMSDAGFEEAEDDASRLPEFLPVEEPSSPPKVVPWATVGGWPRRTERQRVFRLWHEKGGTEWRLSFDEGSMLEAPPRLRFRGLLRFSAEILSVRVGGIDFAEVPEMFDVRRHGDTVRFDVSKRGDTIVVHTATAGCVTAMLIADLWQWRPHTEAGLPVHVGANSTPVPRHIRSCP